MPFARWQKGAELRLLMPDVAQREPAGDSTTALIGAGFRLRENYNAEPVGKNTRRSVTFRLSEAGQSSCGEKWDKDGPRVWTCFSFSVEP
eukprot:3398024-Prymnesium_polylepis.1